MRHDRHTDVSASGIRGFSIERVVDPGQKRAGVTGLSCRRIVIWLPGRLGDLCTEEYLPHGRFKQEKSGRTHQPANQRQRHKNIQADSQ
jgi:hypothetical protein